MRETAIFAQNNIRCVTNSIECDTSNPPLSPVHQKHDIKPLHFARFYVGKSALKDYISRTGHNVIMNTSNACNTFNANRYTFNVTIEQLILLEEALWQRQQIHESIATRLEHTNHEKALRSAYKSVDYQELAQMVTDLINSSQREVLINANVSN